MDAPEFLTVKQASSGEKLSVSVTREAAEDDLRLTEGISAEQFSDWMQANMERVFRSGRRKRDALPLDQRGGSILLGTGDLLD